MIYDLCTTFVDLPGYCLPVVHTVTAWVCDCPAFDGHDRNNVAVITRTKCTAVFLTV